MTKITRVEVIDENGRSYVNWEDGNDVSYQLQDDGRTLKVFVGKVKQEPQTLFDVIRNLGYSHDCCDEIVDAVEAFQKSKEWKPKPQTPEETEKGLRNAMRTAIKEGIIPEIKEPTDELIDILTKNPPSFLKFELGKTLEQVITRWWEDTFTLHENWNIEECIDDLIDQVELFLPRPQSHEGTQNIDTIVAVEAHNELLRKIKSKLRNKKDT